MLGEMGRKPREWVPDGTYHVFSRGSNRQAIFRYDTDRIDLLGCTAHAIKRYQIECLAFAFLPNHCHYMFRSHDGRLSEAMREINGRYALRFNRRYGRDAHVFRNRFGAVLQETDEQLAWTVRYILANPVEAGLCAHAAEWPWTSYRATIGLEPAPEFLAVPTLLSHFGDMPDEAVARLIEFVEAQPEDLGV